MKEILLKYKHVNSYKEVVVEYCKKIDEYSKHLYQYNEKIDRITLAIMKEDIDELACVLNELNVHNVIQLNLRVTI